jgi:predicted P-loop ATPase
MSHQTTISACDEKSTWITQLVDAGYPLTPLVGGTKVPFREDWANTIADPTTDSNRFTGNYGVVLQDDILVIDVDPKKYVDGDDPFIRLKLDLGIGANTDFDTYTVRTRIYKNGQVGLHIYFRKPKGINIQTHAKQYGKAIEFKSYGAMLVGPGSVHPDTKQMYTVVKGDPARLMDVPPYLLRLVERSAQDRNAGMELPTDDVFTRKRFEHYLATSEPAVEGMGGDNHTLQMAMRGRDFNLPQDITLEIMLEHWNPRCSPPWSPEDLATKVDNAYKYAKDSIGNAHPGVVFEPVAPPSDPEHVEAQRKVRRKKALERAEKRAGIVWDGKWDQERQWLQLSNSLDNIINHFRIPHELPDFVNEFYQLVRYNAFSKRIEFRKRAPWPRGEDSPYWTDDDSSQLRAWFSNQRRWNPTKMDVTEGVLVYAKQHQYHPVIDYYRSLHWDGIPRISKLFSYYAGAEQDEYVETVSRCFMIAMIARVMTPGCQHDHMVIMEGRTGTGKSTFCQRLGGPYYLEGNLDPHNKDSIVQLLGKLLVELPEMPFARKADIESTKAFISRRQDTIRLPYGTMAQDIPRQSVFIATTNETGQYLRDQTGNRRYWPIRTYNILTDEVLKDRDQLFAEAFYCWQAGEPHYMTSNTAIKRAIEEQAERTEIDPWVEAIENWVARELKEDRNPAYLSTLTIATEILNISAHKIDRNVKTRIADSMRSMGWEASRVKYKGQVLRGYKNLEMYDKIIKNSPK